VACLARIPHCRTRMSTVSELKLVRERVDLSTEQDDVLNSFAAENDSIVPPRHATYDPLARNTPFVFVPPQPVPLAPSRAARGRARRTLTALALFGAAAWGAYEYQSSHPPDFDLIAAWVSQLAGPTNPKTRAAAAASTETQPSDPTDVDPLRASNESAASSQTDRATDTGSNPSDAKMNEITRPVAAAPQTTGTSGSLTGLLQNVRNVSGGWRLDTQTETGDSSFEGLTLHYEIKLKQDGDRVTGAGTKVSENEKGIEEQTPVTMTGTIAGNRLTLNFVELGTQPEARGKIVLLVDEAGTLRGRFSSSAAPSSGHVEGRRVSRGE